MRLLFVTHNADFLGGGELSLCQLIGDLHKRDHEVRLLVPRGGWVRQTCERRGIEVQTVAMPSFTSLRCLGALWRWSRLLTQGWRPDIIHASTPRAAVYAGIAGRCGGVPVVFHCRIAWVDRRLDWLIARLATCVVANSHATAQRFAGRSVPDIRVVYNGIDVRQFAAESPAKKPLGAGRILLCVARVSRWKRHDIVLDVFDQLSPDLDDLHLVCIGGPDPDDPGWMKQLRERTARLAHGDRVHWLGMRSDVASWYSAADILILASENEPFGRVIVEAMACGVPVVACNRGGPAEIMEQGGQGFLVVPGNTAEMAHRTQLVLQDRGLHDRLATAGRIRAEDFTLQKHTDRMISVFESLTGQVAG